MGSGETRAVPCARPSLMIRPFNVANVNPLPQQSPDMGLDLSQFACQLPDLIWLKACHQIPRPLALIFQLPIGRPDGLEVRALGDEALNVIITHPRIDVNFSAEIVLTFAMIYDIV